MHLAIIELILYSSEFAQVRYAAANVMHLIMIELFNVQVPVQEELYMYYQYMKG